GAAEADRSPVDLVLTPDDKLILTANQTANTVSLLRTETGQVVFELPCGRRPAALALSGDGQRAVVSCTESGDLAVLALAGEKLTQTGTVRLGFEPRGVALAADGKVAYVALAAAGDVAVVDLEKQEVRGRIPVGRWPRFVTLSPDGRRLAVGVSG